VIHEARRPFLDPDKGAGTAYSPLTIWVKTLHCKPLLHGLESSFTTIRTGLGELVPEIYMTFFKAMNPCAHIMPIMTLWTLCPQIHIVDMLAATRAVHHFSLFSASLRFSCAF
jgi:hypothetical protein